MKSKLFFCYGIATLLLCSTLYMVSLYILLKEQIEATNQIVTLCDEEALKLEKKLGYTYAIIDAYEQVVPLNYLDSLNINTKQIKDLNQLIKELK